MNKKEFDKLADNLFDNIYKMGIYKVGKRRYWHIDSCEIIETKSKRWRSVYRRGITIYSRYGVGTKYEYAQEILDFLRLRVEETKIEKEIRKDDDQYKEDLLNGFLEFVK